MIEYLQYILDDFFYNLVDAVALGISLAVLIKIISLVTPLKNWTKIQESSIATAIIWAVILIIFGAFVISGYFVPEIPVN